MVKLHLLDHGMGKEAGPVVEVAILGVQRGEAVVEPQMQRTVGVGLTPLGEQLEVIDLHRGAPPVARVQAHLDRHVLLRVDLRRAVGVRGVGKLADELVRVRLGDFAGYLVGEVEDVVAGPAVIELRVVLLGRIELSLTSLTLAPTAVVHRHETKNVAAGGGPGLRAFAVKVIPRILHDLRDELRVGIAHLRRLAGVALREPVRMILQEAVVVAIERVPGRLVVASEPVAQHPFLLIGGGNMLGEAGHIEPRTSDPAIAHRGLALQIRTANGQGRLFRGDFP